MNKQKNQLQVSVSNSSFVDEGDGIVMFPKGLTITDNTAMRSGTKYDIDSMDVTNYPGQLTGDHVDSLSTLIGKVIGLKKEKNKVTIQGIKYAVKESSFARLAYDLLIGGFSNSFSIETIGPWPDDKDHTYYRHELVGLSQVVVPNNYNAKLNQFSEIVKNSLERSEKDGLDTSGVEDKVFSKVELKHTEAVEKEDMTKQEEKNVEPTNEEPKEEQTEAVVAEDATPKAKEAVEQVEAKEEPEAEEATEVAEVEEGTKPAEVKAGEGSEEVEETPEKSEVEKVAEDTETKEVENKTDKKEEKIEMTAEQIAEIVANAVKAETSSLVTELKATKEIAQNALDAQAKEPAYSKEEEKKVETKNALAKLTTEELFSKQLNAAVAAERLNSVEGRKTLNEINAFNLNALKEAKILNEAITLEDLGNFVISPEIHKEIAGKRTNYQAFLKETTWRETNSLDFSWLTRSSDIDMQPVAIGAHGDVPSPDNTDNRLKPVSSPAYSTNTRKMEEVAAVTPISINVIKHAAADILADAAEGYRNDYDRKRAQLVIARLQQAVDTTGNTNTYDISDGIVQFAKAVARLSDATTVGKLIMNSKTLAMIKGAAIDANQESLLIEMSQNKEILGTPYTTVPNDLLPTLNTAETRVFNVDGTTVTVDNAVFYADLDTFSGRTSGGLKYDVDASASYEFGGNMYSAYQRNEIVLRGSFKRGGVVKDTSVVSAIPAVAVS